VADLLGIRPQHARNVVIGTTPKPESPADPAPEEPSEEEIRALVTANLSTAETIVLAIGALREQIQRAAALPQSAEVLRAEIRKQAALAAIGNLRMIACQRVGSGKYGDEAPFRLLTTMIDEIVAG